MMFGPNISGYITVRTGVDVNGDFSGAFSYERGASYEAVGLASPDRSVIANFSASGSNQAFGRSSSVQPASVRLLPCIKL